MVEYSPTTPMREEEAALMPVGRAVPIVATWTRIAMCGALFGVAFAVVVKAYVTLKHGGQTLGSLAWLIALFCAAETAILVAILRAEEARLARELRTARTGTAVLRSLLGRRSHQVPILGRLFSTQLGAAAVLLADGQRGAAMAALASTSPLMQGGRVDQLRAIVDADVTRASATAPAQDRCIAALRAMSQLGHREADLYRVHVLVKAILERGDADAAIEVATALDASADEEERMYAAWLRVWFDLDVGGEGGSEGEGASWPPLAEG
jgi:hypothetical protein